MMSTHSCPSRLFTSAFCFSIAICIAITLGDQATAQLIRKAESDKPADHRAWLDRSLGNSGSANSDLPIDARSPSTASNADFKSEEINPQTSLILPVPARQESGYYRSTTTAVHFQDFVDSPPPPPFQKVSRTNELSSSAYPAKQSVDPIKFSDVNGQEDQDKQDDENNTERETDSGNAEPNETAADDDDDDDEDESEKGPADSANPRWARKSLRDVKIDIRETAVVAPQDRSSELDYGMGDWFAFSSEPKVFAWCAPNIRYQPLYFEDVALERYGQTLCPRPQTLRSGVHFFRSAFLLPHKMRHDRPGSCDYPLGFCRPGTTTPLTDQRHYFGRPR